MAGISGLYSPDMPLQASNLDMTSTGVKARFAIPFKCVLIRCAVVVNAAPGDAGIVLFKKRPTLGSTSGESTAATVNLATTHTAGKVVYKDLATLVEFSEGDELVAEVTDASANVNAGGVFAIVRQVPEVIGNNTDGIATT